MQYVSGEWADVPTIPQQMSPSITSNKICVVLPFIEKEKNQAADFLKHSTDLCGQIQRTLFLVPFKGINYEQVKLAAEQAFSTVGTIQDSEGKESDWQGRQAMRDAAGPNSFFRQTAWFFYLNRRFGSWLWIEPDCWPNSGRWLYDLEQEHFDVGKPFTGVQMTFPGTDKRYMNGVGIYPWNAVQYAPLLVQSTMWRQHPEIEVGFDVAGGLDVLGKANITRKIQLLNHLAKGEQKVRPETVLCHGRPSFVEITEVKPDLNGKQVETSPGVQQKDLETTKSPVQTTVESKTFLDGTSSAGEPQPSVLGEIQPDESTPRVPDHSTPVQEPVLPNDYGAMSREIRFHVEQIRRIWNGIPSRKVLIVKELRNAKLVPKHFR